MDARKTGKHVEEDLCLKTLSTRRWSLEMMRMNHIRLDPTIMNLRSDTKKYDFQTELAKRRAELRRSLEYGSVIWPLVVDEGMILRDGYCRYTTLAEIGVTETYCYTCEAPTQRGTGVPD